MELIIDFYQSLDTLNLIIFWGIIIVIILLLIFSFILMNKNKKLKLMVEKKNKSEEELPIKKEVEITISEPIPEKISSPEEKEEVIREQEKNSKPIETEKNFIAEEHVMEYNKEENTTSEINPKKPIEMPTGPYQRNVLREMSLSQTSPIGINRQENKIDKKIEIAKDLEESLNNNQIDLSLDSEKTINKPAEKLNIEIKEELTKIEDLSPRKTEIKVNPSVKVQPIYEETKIRAEVPKNIEPSINIDTKEAQAKEILNSQPKTSEIQAKKSSSEIYLEEVSRKLAEAEIPDEIERTNYELKQEEDAIISYKELMEKKDTIQVVDEEEAVISIEELMNRNNKKQEESKEEAKLYNLSEEEENDNFIKELKQFRNDL